jgi:hypothetical protein
MGLPVGCSDVVRSFDRVWLGPAPAGLCPRARSKDEEEVDAGRVLWCVAPTRCVGGVDTVAPVAVNGAGSF